MNVAGKVSSGSARLKPIGEVEEWALRRIGATAKQEEKPRTIETGFPILDEFTGGLRPKDLVLVGCRPGMGLTSFLAKIAWHNAAQKRQAVILFDLEDPGGGFLCRLLAIAGAIDLYKLHRGILDAVEWQRFSEAKAALSRIPLLVNNRPHIRFHTLRDLARQAISKVADPQIGLCIIDFLPLLRLSRDSCRRLTAEEELDHLGPLLKQLAQDLEIPVIAGTLLPRAVDRRDDHAPRLTDLRRQGRLVESADLVLFPYRENYYHPQANPQESLRFIVSKNRHGNEGEVFFYASEPHPESPTGKGAGVTPSSDIR